MRPKTGFKLAVDLLMTLALFFLMGYQFWGEIAHEWAGTGMFVLFLLHHLLNRNWYHSLFKGRYSALRILWLTVDLAVFVAMLCLMYSCILLSGHVFAFLPLSGSLSLARLMHMTSSYWGFLLMNLHLGLHWGLLVSLGRRVFGIRIKTTR